MAKIRCRKCGATIVIDGKANPPSVYTATGEATTEASDDSGDSQAKGLEFTVDFGEGDQRTMTVSEIVAAYNASQITQDTFLWADGFADWKPLADVEEVVAALNAGAAPATAAPWASAAASPARTAARTAGRAPAPDLFGGIDAAGGEDDVATSAPDHSSAPRGGGGGLGLGSSSAASGGGSGTGARNESSVLFSLSALTSAASRPSSRPVAPLTAPSGAATREDSGLIDLKALTAAATKSEASAAPAMPTAPLISPLAASPLGIASPLGGGLSSPATDYGAPQAKSKTGLYIIAAALIVAVAAVAIVFMLRPPPPAPAAAPVVAAAPTPPPAPTPAPTPETTATPPSTGTAAAEDAPKAGAKPAAGGAVKHAGGGAAVKKGGGPAAPAPAAEAPAAPKPKKNPCGCAPGDLQCAMRCAAG